MDFMRELEPGSRHAAYQPDLKLVPGSSHNRSSSWWLCDAADKQLPKVGAGEGGRRAGLGGGRGVVRCCILVLMPLLLLLSAQLSVYYHMKQLVAMNAQLSEKQGERRGLFVVTNVDHSERQHRPLHIEHQQAADSGSDSGANQMPIPLPSAFNRDRSPLLALMLRFPDDELHAKGSDFRASYNLQCLQWVEYMWYAGASLVWWANFGPKPVPLAEEDILRPYTEDIENNLYGRFFFTRLDASASLRDELAKSIASILEHNSTPWIVVCFQPGHLPLATSIDISLGWLALALLKHAEEPQVEDPGTLDVKKSNFSIRKMEFPYYGLSIPTSKGPGTLLLDSMLDLMRTQATPALLDSDTTAPSSDEESNHKSSVQSNSEAIPRRISLPHFMSLSLPAHVGQQDEVLASAMDSMASILMGGEGTSRHLMQRNKVDMGTSQGRHGAVASGESDLLFLILAEERMAMRELADLMPGVGKESLLSTAAIARTMELKRVADAMRLQVHTMAARAAFEVFKTTQEAIEQLHARQEFLATWSRSKAEAEYRYLCSSCNMEHLKNKLPDMDGNEASSIEEKTTEDMESSKDSITWNVDNSIDMFSLPTTRRRRLLTEPMGAQKMLAAVVFNRLFLEDKFKLTKYELVQWVEYYLYAGVDCIYWYDAAHNDDESNEDALKPYVDAEKMVYMRFYTKYNDSFDIHYVQDTSVKLFLHNHKNKYMWALFCDGDEYFFSPKDTAKGFLRRYLLHNHEAAKASQIILQNLFFLGPPLPLPPNALLIERYQYRERESNGPISRTKCIVRTACVQELNQGNPHIFPVTCSDRETFVAPWAELRSNHYWGLRTTDFNPMPNEEFQKLILDNSTLAIVKALKPRLAWAAAATPALQTLPEFNRVKTSLEEILPIYRWLT